MEKKERGGKGGSIKGRMFVCVRMSVGKFDCVCG